MSTAKCNEDKYSNSLFYIISITRIIFAFAMLVNLTSCFDSSTEDPPPPVETSPPPDSQTSEGKTLYVANCAACHGADGSVINGKSSNAITAALTTIGAMSGVSLTDSEVQAISDFLTGNTGGGTADGQALYAANCAACHGNEGATLTDRTGPQIAAALVNVSTMTSITLSGIEILAIADFLAATSDGQVLYEANCAGCHGTDGSTLAGRTGAQIAEAIVNVSTMLGVSLSGTEIAAIADFLSDSTGTAGPPASHTNSEDGVLHAPGNKLPYSNGCTVCHGANLKGSVAPSCFTCHAEKWDESAPAGGGDTGSGGSTTAGQVLYTANCAGCHGVTGSSLSGRTADQISSAISSITSMNNVTLSLTELQAIAAYLSVSSGGNTGGGDSIPPNHTNSEEGVLHGIGNDTPYTNNCTTCHGATLNGDAGPSCFACHGVEWKESSPSDGGSSGGGTSNGQDLFNTNCAACHGAGGSGINDKTSSGITTAINNIASMSNVSVTTTEIQAISDFLSGSSGGSMGGGSNGGGGGTADGEALFTANCATCHGASGSGINGTSVSALSAAINNISSMSNVSVTATEIQAISEFLIGNTDGNTGGGGTTADGQALFNANCATCHGATGSGINDKTSSGISTAISNIGSMSNVSVTASEIQAISDFLTASSGGSSGGSMGGGGNTVDGQTLFTSNCSVCHGANGSGINGTSVSAISAALGNINSMSNVSVTATEIQAISDFLIGSSGGNTGGGTGGGSGDGDSDEPPASHTNAEDGVLHAKGNNYPYTNGCTTCHGSTLAGGTGPSCFTCHGKEWNESAPTGGGGTGGGTSTEGQALYTANCSVCHGASGSNINGRTTSAISTAIANIGSMSNVSLTSTEIQAIADYLTGSTGGGNSGGGSAGLPVNHSNNEEGVPHAPGNDYPYTNGCTNCHGSTLRGDTGPSCYSCHGQEWRESGSGGSGGTSNSLPAGHTDRKDNVLHAPGNDTPYSNGCTNCHGSSLRGDIGPSCYSCHDQRWKK